MAPDPQGQGVLAYSPTLAIKVQKREDAPHRFVAIRVVPSEGAAQAGDELALTSLDSIVAVEAPSMLPRQDELNRFFDPQHKMWAFLDGARAAGRDVELQQADGAWLRRCVHERIGKRIGNSTA